MADTDDESMALSTKVAPVYGGNLYIAFDEEVKFPQDVELYSVFEGSRQRHVTSCQLVNKNNLHSRVPAHVTAESVELTIYRVQERTCHYITALPFYYQYDTAYFMAHFLVDSVYNLCILDNVDQIYSDRFELVKEDLTTLDERLVLAFQYIPLPLDWNLLGENSDRKQEERETLLHFCGRLGFKKLASFLLDKPGRDTCLKLNNKDQHIPSVVALNNKHQELAELFSGAEVSQLELMMRILLNKNGWSNSL